MDPLNLAASRDHDDFVVIGNGDDVDHFSIAFGRANVAQALAAAPLPAITLVAAVAGCFVPFFALRNLFFRGGFGNERLGGFFDGRLVRRRSGRSDCGLFCLIDNSRTERSSFAVAIFADRQQRHLRVGDDKSDDGIAGWGG